MAVSENAPSRLTASQSSQWDGHSAAISLTRCAMLIEWHRFSQHQHQHIRISRSDSPAATRAASARRASSRATAQSKPGAMSVQPNLAPVRAKFACIPPKSFSTSRQRKIHSAWSRRWLWRAVCKRRTPHTAAPRSHASQRHRVAPSRMGCPARSCGPH